MNTKLQSVHSNNLLIIDLMGSDNGALEIWKGVSQFLLLMAFTKLTIVVVAKKGTKLPDIDLFNNVVKVLWCDEEITQHDSIFSFKRKQNNNLVTALEFLKTQENGLLISTVNTGNLLLASKSILKVKNNNISPIFLIKIPHILEKNPTAKYKYFGDLGANIILKPETLHTYAKLLVMKWKAETGKVSPRVGLLNNGHEEHKGTEFLQLTHQLLKRDKAINFVGNIEACDILYDCADIILCSGWDGNLVLKSYEGGFFAFKAYIKQITATSIFKKFGIFLIKSDLKKLFNNYDVQRRGGAEIFPLSHPVFKLHGNSNSETIYNTLKKIYNDKQFKN